MRRHLRRVHRGSSGGNLFGWCDLPRCRQFGNKNESDYIKDIKGMVELLLDRVLVLFESRLTAKDCQQRSKLF